MLFDKITMIDYRKPIADRAKGRKTCGPYTWTPTAAPCKGRGFYQSSKGLAFDRHGSTFALRLEEANDLLPRHSRQREVDGYYIDNFQDETLRPIVARLPRRRGFLAGWTMGRGMCGSIEADIYETAEEAAMAAHNVAEYAAEREREFNEREEDENDDSEE